MSGGHYDYAYYKILELAERLELTYDRYNTDGTNKPLPPISWRRRKFKALLTLVAEAARTIEWVDSGDSGEDDAEKEMDKVFNFLSSGIADKKPVKMKKRRPPIGRPS